MRRKTRTLLLALDDGRKSILLQFLNETKLIKKKQYNRSSDKDRGWTYPILELKGMDFSGAKLDHSIEMDFADLSGANLSKTDLSGATFGGVNLHDADLSGANLSEAKLLTGNKTKLLRTRTKDGKAETDDPERVGPMPELLKMDLSRANLRGADLTGADLTGADLTGANLSGTNLEGAKGLTSEQMGWTIGDKETKLPEYLVDKRPPVWSKMNKSKPASSTSD